MRDWQRLRVFEQADQLVMAVYKASGLWPKDEKYGLTQQIQRAAVSTASNIVEGCSRESVRDYRRFIEIAYGSACEVQYQLSVAKRLSFYEAEKLEGEARALGRSLNSMLKALSPDPRPPTSGERSESSP